MGKSIKISFPEHSGMDRVRNFAEELSLSLSDLGRLPMEEADTATSRVIVSNIHTRDFGRCTKLVRSLLEKHLMTDEAVIT
jgi:hypothetical protein